MSYTLKVRSGLPFTYHAKKSRFYNLDGSDTTLTNTTITDPMIAYQGLATSFNELDNLDTISFTGGELPDYSIANSTVKAYAPSGYTYWDYNSDYGNLKLIGNPSIDISTGIVSNFSTSNYLSEPLGNLGNVWDIYLKFTTASSIITGGQQMLMIGSQNSEANVYVKIFISNDGTLCYVGIGDNAGNFILDGNTTTDRFNINSNTTYYVKLGCDGSKCYFYYSTSGFDSLTLLGEAVGAVTILPESLYIGYSTYHTKGAFGGTIDLSQTYITSNGSIAWSPVGGKLYEKFGDGCMNSEWVDDGSAINYNVFYNANDGFFMDNADYISGSMWTGELQIPSHTVPTYLKQQWTTYGDIIINQQMNNTNNFSGRYIEYNMGAFPENFEMIIKGKFYNTDSTPRWIFADSGSHISVAMSVIGGTDVGRFGTWYNNGFKYRGSTLTEGQNYWFKVRRVNGIKYLYHILDNNNTLDTLPSIENWSSDLIINDKKIYDPDIVNDILRIGNHDMNSLISSQYSSNNFDLSTLQVNELDLHNGKKRQILSSFDNSIHEWVNDDGEQFVLNSNQNSTGDNGCLTDGYGITGFDNSTAACIISDYTFSYSSGLASTTPFEIVAHIKTGSSTTGGNRCIYSSGTSYPGGMYLVVLSDGHVEGCIHNNENNFKAITATALQPNTEYWIKVTNATGFFPTPQYSIYLSTDGVNYTLEGTMPGTIPTQWTTTGNRTLVVGSQNGSSCFGNGGVIYPDDSYIKINGSTVWQLGINI